MAKLRHVPKTSDEPSPDSPPSTRTPALGDPPGRVLPVPRSWSLGGALPGPQRAGPSEAERRRERANRSHPAVDVRRRRSPSSRFRG